MHALLAGHDARMSASFIYLASCISHRADKQASATMPPAGRISDFQLRIRIDATNRPRD